MPAGRPLLVANGNAPAAGPGFYPVLSAWIPHNLLFSSLRGWGYDPVAMKLSNDTAGHLLTDEAVQQFIEDGYVLVQSGVPDLVHRAIFDRLEEALTDGGNPGNNLLPRIPEIQQVLEDPVLQGALTSLLGPDYILNPHLYPHLTPRGGGGGGWHKDCYVWDNNMRHPRFHWVLALYYPQDTTEEMGATGVQPGRHVYEEISSENPDECTELGVPLCGSAGTVALVHFDAWHRARTNTSSRKRYMLKFQFARLREPAEPMWNHATVNWNPEGADRDVARDVWNWLCGRSNGGRNGDGGLKGDDAPRLLKRLREGTEAERLRSAFRLGAGGSAIVPDLLEALRDEASRVVDRIEDKTPDNYFGTNPTALRAAQALVSMGAEAVPGIIPALKDEEWVVRASLADALGLIGSSAVAAVDALVECVGDEHWWVRRNATEALGRIGTRSSTVSSLLVAALQDEDWRVRQAAALAMARLRVRADGDVEALEVMLRDESRYNRFYAALALRRLDDTAANEALFEFLFTSRWCPLTTQSSPF